MPIDYSKIDVNMRELVMALNNLPATQTIDCCGGHENPRPWQLPKECWHVFIWFERNRYGWKSIEKITEAIWLCRDSEGVSELATDFTSCELMFILHGYKSDPRKLAEVIMKYAT
jgi:hypothetical protein